MNYYVLDLNILNLVSGKYKSKLHLHLLHIHFNIIISFVGFELNLKSMSSMIDFIELSSYPLN